MASQYTDDGDAAQHDAALAATRMSTYIESIKAWMSSIRLRPLEDRADTVGLKPSSASLQRYRNEGVDHRPDDCVRDLGVLFDSGMSLARHVDYISGVFLPSVDPSLRTPFVLWYMHSYTRIPITVMGFSFPVRVILPTNYRQFSTQTPLLQQSGNLD